MPTPSREDEACGPGIAGSRHRGRWARPSDRAEPESIAPQSDTAATQIPVFDDIGDPAGLPGRLPHLHLEADTLSRLRLDQRPRRRLLAECVVAPAKPSGMLLADRVQLGPNQVFTRARLAA